MSFPGQFPEHIIADKLKEQELSVSFLVDGMQRLKGGTAANIAFTLALLKDRPVLLSTAGSDFSEYSAWLEAHGVDISGVECLADDFTASCFTNTDKLNNQITFFYPGAMAKGTKLCFAKAGYNRPDDLIFVGPTEPSLMNHYVQECHHGNLGYFYDPSMQAPRLAAEDLERGLSKASWLAGNDYEFAMMASKLGISEKQLQERVPITVMTKGEKGAVILADGKEFVIPTAKPHQIVDPTGAGDAFRAGLLKGYQSKFSWDVCGRMGALCSAYVVEQKGTQQHHFTMDEFVKRYEENFGACEEVRSLL